MADRTARVVGSSLGKGSGTVTASLVTGSITPVSGQVMLLWVLSTFATAPNTPTVTGTNGLSVTWTAVANVLNSGNTQKLTLFRGVPSSGTAGTLTIAFAGQAQLTVSWLATMYTNVNQTTNQGAVQSVTGTANSATSKSLVLAAPANNANAVVYGGGSSENTTATAESGFTVVDTQADARGTVSVEEGQQTATVRIGIAPAGVTFGASGTVNAIAVELTANNALDVRALASDVDQSGALVGLRGFDSAAISQTGSGRFRSVTVLGGAFGGQPAFGSSGPSGYPIGDPAGLAAVEHPGSIADPGYWPFRSQRDAAVGNPSAPSQRQTNRGLLTDLIVPGVAGSNGWSIDVRFEAGRGPYPRFLVAGDPTLGLYADVVVAASAPSSIDVGTMGYRRGGYAWQTLTLSFTLAAAGPVELRREKQNDGMDMVWWDNLRPSS